MKKPTNEGPLLITDIESSALAGISTNAANTSPPAVQAALSLLLDVNALAALLSRSVPSLRRDDAAGRLPAPVRIGKAVRWRRGEIEQWIAAGCPNRRTWQAMRDDR